VADESKANSSRHFGFWIWDFGFNQNERRARQKNLGQKNGSLTFVRRSDRRSFFCHSSSSFTRFPFKSAFSLFAPDQAVFLCVFAPLREFFFLAATRRQEEWAHAKAQRRKELSGIVTP